MKIYALLAAVSLVSATAARGDEALTRLQSDVASMSGEAFAEVDALEEHIMIDPSCARSMLNGGCVSRTRSSARMSRCESRVFGRSLHISRSTSSKHETSPRGCVMKWRSHSRSDRLWCFFRH